MAIVEATRRRVTWRLWPTTSTYFPKASLYSARKTSLGSFLNKKINLKQLLASYVCVSGNVQGWLKSIGSKFTNCGISNLSTPRENVWPLILGI